MRGRVHMHFDSGLEHVVFVEFLAKETTFQIVMTWNHDVVTQSYHLYQLLVSSVRGSR